MGGSGSLALAERYPGVFAASYASQPMTDYRSGGNDGSTSWVGDVTVKWGNPSSTNLKVSLDAPNGWANKLKQYSGNSVWDWQNYQLNLDPPIGSVLRKRIMDEMAPFGITHGSSDKIVSWEVQGKPTYAGLNNSQRTYAATVTTDAHQWMYYYGLPPSMAPLGDTKFQWIPFWGLKVIRDETTPGFKNLSTNSALPPGSTANYNQTILWSSSWNAWDGAPIDTSLKWQMSFCSVALNKHTCGTGIAETVDITPRRLLHFVVKANTDYHWQNQSTTDNKVIASGTVKSDGNGFLTITGFSVSPAGNRLIITP
jgi:hypothetical protein